MDEEQVFGPLSIRQFLYAAAGFGLSFLAYNSLELSYSLPIILVIAGIFIALILNSPSITIDENYIKVKRANSKNQEEFEKWIKFRMAMILSQIHTREERGMLQDPKLEAMSKMLEEALQNKDLK